MGRVKNRTAVQLKSGSQIIRVKAGAKAGRQRPAGKGRQAKASGLWSRGCFNKHDGPSDRVTDHSAMDK